VIRSPRPLYAGALGFGLVALALRLAPAPHPGAVSLVEPPQPARRPSPHSVNEDAAPYAAIVATNIFSPTRAPPAVRFTPDRPTGAVAPAPPKPKPKPKPTGPGIRLFGITKGPDGAVALIDADPKIKGAEIYRLGDRVAGAPLSAINDSTVVITRPSGPLVLHLRSPVKKKRP
jgi:hypothetical protein